MADGQVVFEISADGKKAYAAISDVTEALKKAGKDWEGTAAQTSDGIGEKLAGMFKKISAAALAMKAGKALLDLGKDALQAASDLQEVQNVVDVTFGSGASQIEEWAKTAGESFGLTELQAKRFTSTMGAMLKSSGLAGDQIIEMSTDLAGLAADMASFYNLDFDTAFQKIRAGISGETEPLKQLGVNLSVANLEAFALQQGLSKTFNEMSSGEQTMLRYQYLMQATADAQGDFARTADTSFANLSRKLESNLANIKSNIGSLLIGPVQEATGFINSMLEKLMPTERKSTVLDDLAAIDLQKDAKLVEIQEIADQANLLIGVLEDINTNSNLKTDGDALKFITTLTGDISALATETAKQSTITSDLSSLAGGLNPEVSKDGELAGSIGGIIQSIGGLDGTVTNDADNIEGGLGKIAGAIDGLPSDTSKAEALSAVAGGANDLGELAGSKWQSFADALGSIGADAGGNLQGVANALSTNLGGDAAKWENLLKAISSNAAAALAAVGDNDGSKTKAFLENVAAGADDLQTDYSGYWKKLLTVLGGNASKAISALERGEAAGTSLTNIASGANDLSNTAGKKWQGFIDALGGLAGKGDVPTNLSGVADALAKNIGGKAADWETLLKAVGDNLGKVTTAATSDDGKTAAFLTAAAAAADDLGVDYSQMWTNLLVALGSNAGAAVTALNDATNVGPNLSSIAEGANKLEMGKDIVWTAMYNVLKNISSLNGLFNDNAAGNVSTLATALSTDAPAEEKAQAWQMFLDALGSNAGAIKALTGQDAAGAADWLTALSDALKTAQIDSSNVEAWNALLGVFTEGLSDDLKGDFTSEIITSLLAMGSNSDYARNALAALGLGTDEIDEKQTLWLETCKELVKEIPGLSSIINTETGEVKGGTQAVKDYVKAWQEGQTKLALMNASAQQKTAIENKFAQLPGLELDARVAEKRVRDYRDTYLKALEKYGISENTFAGVKATKGDIYTALRTNSPTKQGLDEAGTEIILHYLELRDAASKARKEVTRQTEAYNEAVAAWEEGEKVIAEMPDELGLASKATLEAAKAASTLSKAAAGEAEALEDVETAVKNAESALTALADYQEKIRKETESSVEGVIHDFNEVVSPMTKARNELAQWNKELDDTSTTKERREELEKLIEAAKKTENAGPSFQKMQAALDSQLEFMQNYTKELATARANGISNEILASLSNGTEESYDYLYALNHTLEGLSDEEKKKKISELNDTYAEVQKTAEEFANTLTDQKLTADKEFDSLVQKVQDAVAGLNLGDTTYAYMSNTLQGIISACGDKSEAIKTAVDGIVAQMQRLSSLGAGVYLTGAGRVFSRSQSLWSSTSPGFGSSANGLDYVPYDGYLALLHQGERVQTAAEADLARRYSYQQPGFDYDAMGGAIGANIGRGNVYLDGTTVGRVISDRQGNAYRALERSGWQG